MQAISGGLPYDFQMDLVPRQPCAVTATTAHQNRFNAFAAIIICGAHRAERFLKFSRIIKVWHKAVVGCEWAGW